MPVAIGSNTLIQRVWGVFDANTGALRGLTTSGETPYVPVSMSLSQSGVPVIMQSSGTIGTNGALTGLTALPQTYANCYLYFPAGAIYAGSQAGSYYTQMSSTTAGTIFNNLLGAGTPTIPTVNALQPFTTTGPGAYVQTTAAINLVTISMPGGTMGPNGALRSYVLWGFIGNTNVKTFNIQLAGNNIQGATVSLGANLMLRDLTYMFNRGVQNLQVLRPPGQTSFGVLNVVDTQYAVDTSVAQSITFQAQLAVATDFIILDGYSLEVIPG